LQIRIIITLGAYYACLSGKLEESVCKRSILLGLLETCETLPVYPKHAGSNRAIRGNCSLKDNAQAWHK